MSISNQMKTAGILAGVLLTLGGLATWDEWQTKKDEKQKETENRLLTLDPSAVTGLNLSIRDGQSPVDISLVKDAEKWSITTPVKASADQQAVDNLLTTLKDYKFEKDVGSAEGNLSTFGLDQPRRKIQLKHGDQTTTLLVGSNTPVGYSVYSWIEGTKDVKVGSQHLAVSTARTLHDLRNKSISDLDVSKVTGLKLTRPGRQVVELKKVNGQFEIIRPEPLAADQSAVRNFINDIAKSSGTEFFDNPEARLTAPFRGKQLAAVQLDAEGAPATTLQFALVDGKVRVWAGGASPVIQLADDMKGKLEKSSSDLRDRKIFSFAGEKVTSLKVDGKSFVKKNGEWLETSANGEQPAQKVRSLIVDLEFAKAQEILGAGDKNVLESTRRAAMHSLELTFDDGTPPIAVSLWENKGKGDSWVLQHSDPKAKKSAFIVSKAALAAIEQTPDAAAKELQPGATSENSGLNIE